MEPGARVADRYVLEDRLGEGGMGVVWRARDERLGRAVALKVLSAASIGDAEARARLVREARAAAVLEHPGIVHVYDVGETDDGGAFLVMERVRGLGLRALVERGKLSRAEGVRVIAEVAKALSYAHAAGFVHRDIKPDNVMVRDDGRAVVLDFGLAKSVATAHSETVAAEAAPATLTAKGSFLGTPAYLAPEQAQGETVDGRADQFALGVTAYEVLTGRLPWQGTTAAAVVASVMRDEPLSVRSVRPELPEELDVVLRRAMAKRANDRFESVDAFAQALSEIAPRLDESASAVSAFARTATTQAKPPAGTVSGSAVDATPATERSAARRRRALAIAIALTVPASMTVYAVWRAHALRQMTLASQSTPPLSTAGSVLACPQLAVSGVEEPSGWMGAAAASIVCSRAQVMLEGHASRTLVPAELLDLPPRPREDFPRDPYVAPDARDRAVAAARSRAAAWVDGTIARAPGAWRVSLVLRARDDREIGRGEGSGRVVLQAVRAAMDALPAGALPAAGGADPFLREWLGAGSVQSALALHDLNVALLSEDATASKGECARVETRADLEPSALYIARSRCADRLYQTTPIAAPPPEIDRSSPGALLRSAHALRLADRLPPALFDDEVTALASSETRAEPHALLAAGVAEAKYDARARDAAHRLAVESILASPKATDVVTSAWHRLAFLSDTDVATTRGHAAWIPWEPFAQAYATASAELEERVRVARRAYLLGPHGYWPINLGRLLLQQGHREEARAVAVESGSDALPLEISNSEARFAETLRRARELFASLPNDREGSYRAFLAMEPVVDAAVVLGRPLDFADDLVTRYFDPEPTILSSKVVPLWGAVVMCASAPRPTAKRCMARLADLFRRGLFAGGVGNVSIAIEGALHYVDGDWAGAAKVWRPAVRGSTFTADTLRHMMATAFDRAGDYDLAEKVDGRITSAGGRYNGADPAYVRSALRAEKRGDKERARKLAQAVVDAWGVADETVPAVAEMRALLARTK